MDVTVTDVQRTAASAETPWQVLNGCAGRLEHVWAAARAEMVRKARSASGLGRRDGQTTQSPDEPEAWPEGIVWLLENGSYLRVTLRETREMLSRRYYRGLPVQRREAEGGRREAVPESGIRSLPYIRVLAREFVEACSAGPAIIPGVAEEPDEAQAGALHEEALVAFFEEAQSERPLALRELWAIAPMLRLALFERLRDAIPGDAGGAVDVLRSDGTIDAATVRRVITALRGLDELPWRELTESLCALDGILREDPAGIYAKMDFETRDACRRAVERIAKAAKLEECEVARLAIDLADRGSEDRRRHVGYYLIGRGLRQLEDAARCRRPLAARIQEAAGRHPELAHLGGASLFAALLLVVLGRVLHPIPGWYLMLLAIPASEAAITVANAAAHALTGPTRLPRLDFSDGIPDGYRTLVVVPALLLSARTIDELCERLEINYLANRDRNLLFALLTDMPDSTVGPADGGEELGEACAEAIRRLNERHARAGGRPPFYLFHREQAWNAKERVWMGHERKRGKLNALNAWLLGGPDPFSIKAGQLESLGSVRFVITLDADTRLPLDAARTLVATAAHPLNRPIVDPGTHVVRDGYAILQPRVSVSMESAASSRLARIRSGMTGVDPYATAVSDVYQDVYGQGTFTGKGLYDLAAYREALEDRFPDNALLSHDLIEGEHARVGLVSDVEVVDDYPRNYEVYSKRKHRWTRGDWQLLYWLLPWVPAAGSRWIRNPLSALSRWKIVDNLRRSIVEIGIAVALACAWFVLPAHALRASLAIVALLAAGVWADVLLSLLRLPPRRLLRGFVREKAATLAKAHADVFISLGLALHQAMLMGDAIARTLVRCFVTRRRLLQWETTAQAESAAGRRTSLARVYLIATPVVAGLMLVASPAWRDHKASLVIAGLWMCAPLLAGWLNRPPTNAAPPDAADVAFLRGVALRTWRYFDEWSGPGEHYLVPDTVQASPEHVARQTSPTNIGLQLAATLAARDFGYITSGEMALACARVLDTVGRLERYRGHLYNWYDTRTLAPLPPRYVSTVDSGNLCAALLALKVGCDDVRRLPIAGDETRAGLRDYCVRARKALPRRLRRRAVARSITAMMRRLDAAPADLFGWANLLAALRPSAIALDEWLRVHEARTGWRDAPSDLGKARAWAGQLVGRIEQVGRELRRAAPWVDLRDGGELPHDRLPALGEVPSPARADLHYAELANQVRAAMAAGHISWQQQARLLRQIAAGQAALRDTDRLLADIASRCDRVVEETDFAFLFDSRRKLLRIGCNVDTGEMDASYYDLLASEARTAVLLAIAKRDIPGRAWLHLGRKLTAFGRRRVLASWGGTMFEHLMPSLFMRPYEGSLVASSLHAMVGVQQEHARAHGVPWGFSEAAHAVQDDSGRYAYRTFGVPQVAVKRLDRGDLVVAPYAALLATMIEPAAAIENLRQMASRGWIGRYGFYESIDFSGSRGSGVVVRSYMAHHLGMSLVALCNTLFAGRMQERFHRDRLVAAAERLLQERLPTRLPAAEIEWDRALVGVRTAAPGASRVAEPRRRRSLPAALETGDLADRARKAG